MISYTMVGTKDLKKACDFYDKVLSEVGAKRTMEFETAIVWGTAMDKPMFSVCLPFNGKKATACNVTMISLSASSPEQVDALYNSALANGGKCEGAPGPRGGPNYMAYFRDLDGNKLAAYNFVA